MQSPKRRIFNRPFPGYTLCRIDEPGWRHLHFVYRMHLPKTRVGIIILCMKLESGLRGQCVKIQHLKCNVNACSKANNT
jgi:hypothetical protein